AVTTGDAGPLAIDTNTDPSGIAAANIKLGFKAGAVVITASAGVAMAVQLAETATPGPINDVTVTNGDMQTGPAGETLPMPIDIAVTDEHLNPIAGAAVDFTPITNGGSFVPPQAQTDSGGHVTAMWTLGPVAEPSMAKATSGGHDVTFQAAALVGAAA